MCLFDVAALVLMEGDRISLHCIQCAFWAAAVLLWGKQKVIPLSWVMQQLLPQWLSLDLYHHLYFTGVRKKMGLESGTNGPASASCLPASRSSLFHYIPARKAMN